MTSAFADPPDTSALTLRPSPRWTVRPAPPREPPFDDEMRDTVPVGRYDQPLPFDRPARRAPHRAWQDAECAEAAQWGRRLLIGVIEVSSGRRPLRQIRPLLTPSIAQGIRADADRSAAGGPPHRLAGATLGSVRVCLPGPGVAELAATVRHGARTRAVALRLERRRGQWCCTRLLIG